MKKRFLSYVMAIALIVAGLCIPEAEPVFAAGIKISSAEDLLAMEENPFGDYYLANDITVPENTCLFADGTPFMGTLDGKGHKLNGYKSTGASAIFDSARFAEFKNLSVTDVDIKSKGSVAALVCSSDGCAFKNIKVSGKIVSSGDGGGVGAIAASGSGSMEKCENSAKITAKTKKSGKYVGGLAGDFAASSLKNCSNSGAVTLTTGTGTYVFDVWSNAITFSVAGLVAEKSDKVTSCKNSGNVTLNLKYKIDVKNSDDYRMRTRGITVYAGGICPEADEVTSSGNTGKIKVTSGKSAKVTKEVYVGGVIPKYWLLKNPIPSKCYNTGAVSFSGSYTGNYYDDECCRIGGLFGCCVGLSECYNTGNVSVSLLSDNSGLFQIGGISGATVGSINNCYNTGNVTVTNKGKKDEAGIIAGGLSGYADVLGVSGTCNYSTGVVKAPKDVWDGTGQGLLIGEWAGPRMMMEIVIYDNYYTASGKAYGFGDTTWEPFWPTAKKVSAITSGNCPKLSSKYWTYSSKHKRMVLKNNEEK